MPLVPQVLNAAGGSSRRRLLLRRLLYWGLPPLLCVVVYWHGLMAWFQMDDFAWLSIHTHVSDFPSLLSALFRPMAQGTVRPLSERLFFLSFWHLFGMEALPYRVLVFATQFANLALISLIMRKLTGSALAGFAAPLLWLASPVLYLPLTWTSAYNQILCSFFLLASLFLLLRYVDTGRVRHYVAMWSTFLLGFGALELNVVFPAIACLYTFLFARRYLMRVAPMFLVAVTYAVWHRSVGRSFANELYAMNYHPMSLIWTFAQYTWLSVTALAAARVVELPDTAFYACSIGVLIALGGFVAWMLWKRQWLIVFFVGWYVITLGPYLPLANHVSDYYLTIPTIGLAMLGGWAISLGWRARTARKAIAVVAVLLFAVPCVWQAWTLSHWYSAKSRRVRDLVRGVAAAHARSPKTMIVLHGVDDDLFWLGLFDQPEAALGLPKIYMTAETQATLSPLRNEDISDRFLPESVTVAAVQKGQAAVYDVSQRRLRNISSVYTRLKSVSNDAASLPRFIDAANPLFAPFLGEGWYEIADGLRWTTKRAVLRIAGPGSGGKNIRVRGRVVEAHTAAGPLSVTLWVNESKVGTQAIAQGTVVFELNFPLPAEVLAATEMMVALETNRTVSPATDPRPFGLAMGTVAVVP